VILPLRCAAAYYFSSLPRTVAAIVTASPPISLASSIANHPAQMIDNPEEQAVIDRIRQLRAEGKGLRKIAKHLEEAGIPVPREALARFNHRFDSQKNRETCFMIFRPVCRSSTAKAP